MQEFIVGKSHRETLIIPETSYAVSHEHAKITILDDGAWVVESLSNTNPLFVQQPDGQLVQVGRKRITPDTILVLGANNSAGFRFYARNVLGQQSDPLKFKQEFLALQSELETLQADERAFKKKSKIWDKVRMFGSGLALVLAFAIAPLFVEDIPAGATPEQELQLTKSNSQKEMNATRVMMVCVPIGLSILVGIVLGDRDRFAERRKRLRCPNPQCNARLGDDDIAQGRCPRCRSHI